MGRRYHVSADSGRVVICNGAGVFVELDGGGQENVGSERQLAVSECVDEGVAWTTLSQSEKHGIAEYENALDSQELSIENVFLLRTQLLPQCRENVTALDSLTERLEQST